MRSLGRWHLLMTLATGLALVQTGCKKEDPNAPETWIAKLSTPQRGSAIAKLAEMKATAAVGPLKDLYKSGLDRPAILSALAKIGDKSAAPVMIEALSGTEGPLAQIAGEALKSWEIKNTDAFLAVATNARAPREGRYAALELLAMGDPDPKIVDPLIPILEGDPDAAPIAYIGQAAEALGKLHSEKAIPGLIRCQWLDDHQHRNEVPACRLALARIGKKAVPAVLDTLGRKNRDVEDRAHKFQYDVGGLVEAKCAEVLGDMPDASAVDPLITALKKFDDLPSYIQDPRKAQMFVMTGVQKVISVASALAAIGDERAVKALLEIAGDKELALEHKLAAVQQLGFLGQPSAVPGLMKLLAVEAGAEDPVSNGFRVQIALNLANVLDGSDQKAVDAAEKAIKGIQDKIGKWADDSTKKAATATGDDKKTLLANAKGYTEWKGNYDEAVQKLAVTRECKSDLACWAGKLTDKNEATAIKAAYRLANERTDKAAALKALVTQAGSENLVLRNVVFFGLGRVGDASIIPELQKIREADETRAKKDKRFEGSVFTTDLMIARLGAATP